MNLKSMIVATVVATGMFTTAAQATPVWTLTAEGTIAYGTDNAGVFGTVGQDLHNVGFKQTITVSVDPAKYGWSDMGSIDHSWLYGSFPGFTESITINNKTQSYLITQPIYAQQSISSLNASGGYYNDSVYSYQYGNDDDQNQIFAMIQASTSYAQYAFVPAGNFDQQMTVVSSVVNMHSSASAIDSMGHQLFRFEAYPDQITVNVDQATNQVPEPASVALLGVGVLAICAIRRRKQAKA